MAKQTRQQQANTTQANKQATQVSLLCVHIYIYIYTKGPRAGAVARGAREVRDHPRLGLPAEQDIITLTIIINLIIIIISININIIIVLCYIISCNMI